MTGWALGMPTFSGKHQPEHGKRDGMPELLLKSYRTEAGMHQALSSTAIKQQPEQEFYISNSSSSFHFSTATFCFSTATATFRRATPEAIRRQARKL
jgi:hypothetical protein